MHPFLALDRPHLFGHRGASGEAPENTLVSFERARAAGVPYLETDCHATSDGVIVLQHDETLDRTTDGEGPVREHSYAELEQLDAGYRFTPDGGATFPFRGTGIRILRLSELISAFPGARVNLEIKAGEQDTVDEVIRLIRSATAERRFLLVAEADAIMARIRSACPGTALGTSRGGVLEFFAALGEGRIAELAAPGDALQIPPAAFGQELVTPESIEAAHSLSMQVHVWTINDPAEMRRLLALGVDGLMSDYPEKLVREARS